jgi:hypothetical protein
MRKDSENSMNRDLANVTAVLAHGVWFACASILGRARERVASE